MIVVRSNRRRLEGLVQIGLQRGPDNECKREQQHGGGSDKQPQWRVARRRMKNIVQHKTPEVFYLVGFYEADQLQQVTYLTSLKKNRRSLQGRFGWKMPTLEQHGRAVTDAQMLSGNGFNPRPGCIEGIDPACPVTAFYAEMIFERLDGYRARYRLTIYQRSEHDGEIVFPISGGIG